MSFEAVFGGHHYETPAWPITVAFAALIALMGAVVWARAVASRSRRVQNSAGALVFFGLGTMVTLGYVSLAWMGLLWGEAAAELGPGDADRAALALFPWLCVVSTAAGGGAGMLATIGGTSMLYRAPDPKRSRVPVWLVLLACSFVAQTALVHVLHLATMSGLPMFSSAPHPDWVQRGRDVEVVSELAAGDNLDRWDVRDASITIEDDGLRVSERAERMFLTVWREATIPAFEERGTPLFDLRVGNTWIYQHERITADTALLGFATTREDHESSRLRVEVTRENVVRGVRVFSVVTTNESDDSESATTSLYARDGELYVMPAFAPSEVDSPLEVPPYDDRAREVEYPMLGCNCRGNARLGENVEVPGPCWCERHEGMSGAGVFLTIMTLGMISPGSRRDQTWRLMESRRGDGDPVPVTDPLPEANPPALCPPRDDAIWCVFGAHSVHGEVLSGRAIARLERAGLSVTSAPTGDLWLEGTLDQVRAGLSMDVSITELAGLCPSDRVCSAQLTGRRPRAFTFVTHELTLEQGPCAPSP